MYTFLNLDVDDRSEISHASAVRNDKLYKSPAPPVSAKAAKDLVELASRAEGITMKKPSAWGKLVV